MVTVDYGTFTKTDVISQVAVEYLESEVGKTATYAVTGFEVLAKNPKPATGSRIEWTVRAENPGRAKNFKPQGSGDGQTAVEPDNKITLATDFTYTGQLFLVDRYKMSQIAGGEQKIDYVEEQTDDVMHDVKQKLNRNVYYGSGTSPDPIGLKSYIAYGSTTSTVAGATQSASAALVGNRLDAGNIDTNFSDTTLAASNVAGATSITLVTGGTRNDGDLVFLTSGSGDAAVTKRHYVASDDSGSGTTLKITPQIRLDQPAGALTVKIQAPFYAANQGMGAANARDLAKINRAISLAADGKDAPDGAFGDELQYEFFMNETLATEQSTSNSDKNEMGPTQNYGFRYRTLLVQQDNNINDGELFICNSKYLMFKGNPEFLQPSLLDNQLVPEASVSANGFGNLIGTVSCSRQLCCNAFNRQSLIVNMNA